MTGKVIRIDFQGRRRAKAFAARGATVRRVAARLASIRQDDLTVAELRREAALWALLAREAHEESIQRLNANGPPESAA